MGCTGSLADQPIIKVLPLDSIQITNYIDEIPLILLQKLNQKFSAHCDKSSQLNQRQFEMMYYHSFVKAPNSDSNQKTDGKLQKQGAQAHRKGMSKERAEILLARLYLFYSDLGQNKLKFKSFINKYSILTRSEDEVISDVIYFINASSKSKEEALNNLQLHPLMTLQEYKNFIFEQSSYFGFKPDQSFSQGQETISQKQFSQMLKQSGFYYNEYRVRFSLFDKEDFPFQEIGRKLVQLEMTDYSTGQQYYIISSKWFEQWSFYYQGTFDFMEKNAIKSTKILPKKKHPPASGKNRRSSVTNKRIQNRSSREIDLESGVLVEKPTHITFETIEGEYVGELKDNIRADFEVKVVSAQIWELFKKTMPAKNCFKRIANSPTTLELYPKNIYFLKTDKKGTILDSQFEIIQVSLKSKLCDLYSISSKRQKKQGVNSDRKIAYSYFVKQFSQENWVEQDGDRALGRCSTESRFFVVETACRTGFLQKYTRKVKDQDNLTYGDKVQAFFSYTKKSMPAIIIRVPEKLYKVHFFDYNFRYEVQVKRNEVSPGSFPEELQNSLRRSMDLFSYKGIKNIGNTCFINTVIQCLIATPIFSEYISSEKFHSRKQPLLSQVSAVSKLLLTHNNVSPYDLKKTIDMELQIFSGNDQHDAQQFLGFLLDKFSNQIKTVQQSKEESDIIQQLFEGKTSATVICEKCHNESKMSETLNILSLPIPQPEFNTYTIFIFPITKKKIRKIIFRLISSATLHQYLNCFEERIGQSATDYIFTQNNAWTGKKIRKDFFQPENLQKKMQDLGITPSIEIFAYEKFLSKHISEIYEQNKYEFETGTYFDYFDTEDNKWIYGRYLDLKLKQKLEIMEIQHPFRTSVFKTKNKLIEMKEIAPLGLKTKEEIYKKVYMRKYNTVLEKMQVFGFSIMISYPKIVTFDQLQKLVKVAANNYVEKFKKHENPFFMRIIQMNNKHKCIFCGKTDIKPEKQELKNCCVLTKADRETPLIWITKENNYIIYLEWGHFSDYNIEFSSGLEIDSLSQAADKQKQAEKVQIEECLKLLQKSENVEMKCDKCQHNHQRRKQIMKDVPNILILHLKQFRMLANQAPIKLDVNLKMTQYLDLSNFSENEKGCLYELYAYIRHTGTSNSGHYTCVARRKHLFEENKKVWVNFDDENTEILEKEQTNIDSAYLLFFKKVDMPNSTYLRFTSLQQGNDYKK